MALGRLGVRGPHTVLDAGCGTGRNLPGLARTVIGVDHSVESLKVARARLPRAERQDLSSAGRPARAAG
ncbi:class I SAM-dependent methyltransferase [Rubrobacter indicoceani]|uniref:class I SAM-dependent methyltransferase n=1 Tax=Rubrobacter indicoceani TaxID=2051957 RepID=UPI000E5A69DF